MKPSRFPEPRPRNGIPDAPKDRKTALETAP